MPVTSRSRLVPAVALAVAACVAAVPGSASSEAPAPVPATPPTPALGPVAYYVANCARCHGDVSAAYVGVDHPKRGKELEDVIAEMAEGPGNAPLDAEGLKRQTALHEAMFGRTPFVWLDPAVPGRLSGEVLAGTALAFEAGGTATPVKISANRFDVPRQAGTLVATRAGVTRRLPVAAAG